MIGETGRLQAAGHMAPYSADPPSLPITRATALRRWRAAILTTGTVEFLVILTRVLHEPTPTPAFGERITALIEALAVPVLLILTTSYAERHLLGRPPKSLLLAELSLFSLGTALAILASISPAVPELLADTADAAALCLGAAWFVSVLIVSPVANQA